MKETITNLQNNKYNHIILKTVFNYDSKTFTLCTLKVNYLLWVAYLIACQLWYMAPPTSPSVPVSTWHDLGVVRPLPGPSCILSGFPCFYHNPN